MDRRRYGLLTRTWIYLLLKKNLDDVSDFRGKIDIQFKFRHCQGLCGIVRTFNMVVRYMNKALGMSYLKTLESL